MLKIAKTKITMNYIISAICLVSAIYMIGILVWTSSYSVYVEDDFTIIDMIDGISHNIWSYLKLAVKNTFKTYREWQGTYLGCFLYVILNSIGQNGLCQHRWIMAINSALFFLALLLFLVVAFKKLGLTFNAITSIIFTTVIFSLCGYETYPEIFFWFTGAVVYSFPTSFLLISMTFFLLLDDDFKRSAVTIISATVGILSMGGALLISSAGCYFALLVTAYQFITNKKIPKNKMIVFFSLLTGALINSLAPGNFIRHSSIEGADLNIIYAVINAFSLTIYRWKVLLSYNFLLPLCIIFLCGLFFIHQNKLKPQNFFFAFLGLLTPVVSSFPYALGTNNSIPANRCAFIIDLCIILSSFFFMFYFGTLISSATNYKLNKYILAFAMICMFFYCKYDGYGLSDFKTYELTELNSDHVFKYHYTAHVDFYEWLRSQKGEDVIVTPEHCPYGIDNVHNLILRNDPNHWVNKLISRYCGIRSVASDYD